jgi:hypothetical protein
MGIFGFVKGLLTGLGGVEPDLVKSTQIHRPTMAAPTTRSSRKPRKRNAKGQFVSEA